MAVDDRTVLRKLKGYKGRLQPVQVMDAKDIGQYVKAVRKNIGLTQEELAYISGVGISFIHDLEHGKKSLQFDSLMKVVNRLGCDILIQQRGATGHVG
jgi:y4mF family transcriptional regulator